VSASVPSVVTETGYPCVVLFNGMMKPLNTKPPISRLTCISPGTNYRSTSVATRTDIWSGCLVFADVLCKVV
jgi:hypothetical protein